MSVYINTDSVIHFSLPKSNSCLFAATLLKHFYHNRIPSILCKEKNQMNFQLCFLSFEYFCSVDDTVVRILF